MPPLDIKIENNMMFVNATGNLTADEVMTVVNEYYPNGVVKDAIWDLTNGTLQSITRVEFEKIAKASKAVVSNGARQGGKTACVAGTLCDYGLMRMYTVIAEMACMYTDYHVFNTVVEAINWIKGTTLSDRSRQT